MPAPTPVSKRTYFMFAFRCLSIGGAGICAALTVAIALSWQSGPDARQQPEQTVMWISENAQWAFQARIWSSRLGCRRAVVASLGPAGVQDSAYGMNSACPLPNATVSGLRRVGYRDIVIAGWPLPAVWGGYDDPPYQRSENELVSGPVCAIPIGASRMSVRGVRGHLPIGPLWPGLIVNGVVLAAIGIALHQGVAVWRARRRRVRGMCPRCGYSLVGVAGGSPCPECGREAGDA